MSVRFKHAPKEHYARNVSVKIPLDYGKFNTVNIEMHFRRLSVDELTERLVDAQNVAKQVEAGEISATYDHAVIQLLRDTVGWAKVIDEDGQEVPFTEENYRALLNIPCYRRAISTAYNEDLLNPEGNARKN
jgi:hypothetical protein